MGSLGRLLLRVTVNVLVAGHNIQRQTFAVTLGVGHGASGALRGILAFEFIRAAHAF